MHAGVDLTMEDWRQTAPKDFCGFANPFIKGKIIQARPLFWSYHYPMLHGDMQTTDLWQSDGKIGIDGGAIFGGSVHGVIFNEKALSKISNIKTHPCMATRILIP